MELKPQLEIHLRKLDIDVTRLWWTEATVTFDDRQYVAHLYHSPVHPLRAIKGETLQALAINIWQEKVGYKFGRIIR